MDRVVKAGNWLSRCSGKQDPIFIGPREARDRQGPRPDERFRGEWLGGIAEILLA
ncbi:MAG: hypothetical protein HYU41_15615 [Candidatus Rokubacteria bacterium]|nr:hypothetical protein [Candidatus Rokubacteria bacterium]